jgi:hypothetical protein
MDFPAEDDLAAAGLHDDPRRVQICATMQRLLDLFFDLRNLNRRVDPDQVGDASDAGEVVDGGFGFALLETPIDIAG